MASSPPPPPEGGPAGNGFPRIFLYSPDPRGLGHLRRSLVLADALTSALPWASVLLVTGSPCATFFRTPRRVEIVKLPAISRQADGTYVPRSLTGSLRSVWSLRRAILEEAFRTFEPDLLLVDHQPLGLLGEALGLLREARDRGVRTVLGLQDVIDDPTVLHEEWRDASVRWALRESYDRICVYGVPEVFDPRLDGDFPADVGARLELVGYVAPAAARSPRPAEPRVLVTAGGGEDGASRLGTYLDALAGDAPWKTTLLPGPLCRGRRIRGLVERLRGTDVELVRGHADVPGLLARCTVVVALAGYSTCAELLRSGRRAVFLPRTCPHGEQALRAGRLAELGHGTCVPDASPGELRACLESLLELGAPPEPPDLGGATRLTAVVAELLGIRLEGEEPVEELL